MVEPAALDDLDVVEVGDVVGGEEGCADIADEAADAVNGKDVEGVVDAQDELQLGGVVGKGGTEDAVGDSCPDGDVTFETEAVVVSFWNREGWWGRLGGLGAGK